MKSTINYYLKIINKDNYIKNEEVNKIVIIESNHNYNFLFYSKRLYHLIKIFEGGRMEMTKFFKDN